MATQKSSPWGKFTICLPHPYLTRYHAIEESKGNAENIYRIALGPDNNTLPPSPLHNSTLTFTALKKGQDDLPEADNGAWARARRNPSINIDWISSEAPSVGQLWLLIYALFTVYHTEESIRVILKGVECDIISSELIGVGLAISHPKSTTSEISQNEILILRSSFWQGAGSPFTHRSAWTPPPPSSLSSRPALTTYPLLPTTSTLTTLFPNTPVHATHPIRPAKPLPGSTFYSRYIPHLDEHFSMIALDYTKPEHLHLFHTWQNDPRVAAGWNETGTLEQHRQYLKNLHEDPHTFTMLAAFQDKPFAYFEVYWAKEDHLGAHYPFHAYDRGRHSLVGDPSFRGPHRAHAWWSSLMHFMFLDDPRTENVVGEPKWTNKRVLELDAEHGFHVEKLVDLGHKRSALVRCSRERFFGLATVGMPFLGAGRREEKL